MPEDFEHREARYQREGKRNGIIVAIIIHSILVLFFVATMAWTPPDPPPPRYGVEVSFGFESNGSGSVQNKTTPNKSESLEKAKPNPKPTPDPAPDPTPVPKPEPVQPKPTPKPTPTETETVPIQEEADKGVEAVEEAPKPKPDPDPKPVESEKGATSGGGTPADNSGTADEDLANNQGDNSDTTATGDQGKADGNINEDALLGGGSGGGTQLRLDGWKWDQPPSTNDGSSETGQVTIRFKINDEGTVVDAVVASGYTVTPSVAQFYRQYVETEMTFSPKGGLGKLPKFTIGSITFILTAK